MHLQQLPSGSWRVIVQVNGQKRTATAKTKPAARQKGHELAVELGQPLRRTGITVIDMLVRHLVTEGPSLSPTTLAEYRRVIERLEGATDFGGRDVSTVRAPDVDALYHQLALAEWAVGTIARLHELMHAAWRRTAIFNGWADYNPVSSVRKPPRAPHTIEPPEPQTVKRLLDAGDDQFRVYVRLAATTGARRGELVGLQWGDIDFERAEVFIQRSLVYTPDFGIVVRQTKTGKKGQRRIALGSGTLELLQRHHERASKLAADAGLPDPLWVFSHDAGVSAWFPTTPTALFSRLRDEAGVEGVRLHDLRHYVATQMLGNGESPAQVAARLGHSNSHTTLRTYAHWIPARDRDAADALDAELD